MLHCGRIWSKRSLSNVGKWLSTGCIVVAEEVSKGDF